MRALRNRTTTFAVLFLLAFLALVLHETGNLRTTESVVLTALSPVQHALTYVTNQAKEIGQTVYDRKTESSWPC